MYPIGGKQYTYNEILADFNAYYAIKIILENFDVKKFMKKNPNMTSPDFYMVMFNETEGLVK